jgi:8-hydroxy-5-deazaflavin:NADPH oxidoreductase
MPAMTTAIIGTGNIGNAEMIRTLPDGQSAGSVVAALLPAGAHYVKDDDMAAATARRLIEATGFDPVKVGGVADAGRIEVPGGDIQAKVLALDEARVEVPA